MRGVTPRELSPVIVRELTNHDAPAWDKFVFAADDGTFFHRAAWAAIFRQVFRLQPHYLLAERDGKIAGILPLVHQKSIPFGNALISTPFCVLGGPIATDKVARAALDSAAISLMRKIGARYIEFRSRAATRPAWRSKGNLYATFSHDLSASVEENLLAIPRKQRAVIRKALASSLTSEPDKTTDRLYRVYSESVRNLGTPMFPRKYFPALLEAFGEDCDIVVILENGKPVSAVMNFYFRESVLPYYGGGTKAARRNGANDFLYWEVMRRAVLRGCRRFDFGRSKAESGAFAFKKNWGFKPDWLEYEYYLQPGEGVPEKNPLNPRYALFIETWRRLPLPIANALGPLLIAGLG
jgi:FemAB-related protein (PEP-CTERM system-associated)